MMEEVDMAGNLFLGTRVAGSRKTVEDQIFEGTPVHIIEEEEEERTQFRSMQLAIYNTCIIFPIKSCEHKRGGDGVG